MRRPPVSAILVVLALVAAACSDDGGAGGATTTAAPAVTDVVEPTDAPTTTPASTSPEPAPADFDVQPGTEQLAVLAAEPGLDLELVDDAGSVAAAGTVDEQGSLLFRDVQPGDYTVRSTGAEAMASEAVAVAGRDEVPPSALYAEQRLAAGFGYITVRDGTTLSANVVLPGPADGGPYPTVVEYSGYAPSNPDDAGLAQVFTALGYAYVGVNMRGSGCSGGSFRFFELVQNLDGYDVIETVAAQPWVQDHRVGMVGISYPGISQLFVASTQPPSLAAITPLSVIDDSYQATLYPGGLLNTGFAVEWTSARMAETAPYGQQWTEDRADGGDEQCAVNQALRLQNPDLVAEIRANPYYSAELGDPIAPRTFVDRIDVPVFLAGAWQDEQTGGHFATMLDRFTGSPHFYATLVNGLHTEAIGPGVLPRLVEFLDLYVAERVPSLAIARAVAPVLGSTLFGAESIELPPDRFTGMTYDEALAAFEADPPIQVLFEEGAADGTAARTPLPRFTASFDAWPVPEAEATSWYLGDDGSLGGEQPPAGGESSYTADPSVLPATFYEGGSSDIWRTDVQWDWRQIPDGTGAAFMTEPLGADTVVVGSGSADLWVRSSAADTDLEVTISEVRPDGQEMYVQSGWLRASQRALDGAASTDLRPVHTFLEADTEPLPADEFSLVRVELFPFAHAFRAGSRLRLTIDAPGNNRATWEFDTIVDGETVTIASGGDHPSAIVLPVVAGIDVPAAYPECGALRGQPCRPAPQP